MTENQKKLLDFVTSYIGTKGHSPSYQEISEGIGIRSKGNIGSQLKVLEEAGHIRLSKRFRGIEIINPNYLLTAIDEALQEYDACQIGQVELVQQIRAIVAKERRKH